MKKQLLILLSLLTITFLQVKSQTSFTSGDGSMTVTIDKPNLSGGGGYDQGVSTKTARNEYHEAAPSSGEVISSIYNEKHSSEYNKAIAAWNVRDWDKVIKHFKESQAYLKNTKSYESWIKLAKGLKEWDKGVEAQNKGMYDKAIGYYIDALKFITDTADVKILKDNISNCYWAEGVIEAKAKHWDAAIAKYKEALKYNPDNQAIKENIIYCSLQKTKELAENFMKEENWVEAGVYYNILLKNFEDHSYQSEYSKCLSEISAMNQNGLFNTRLSEEKQKLPFINSEWGN